MKCVSPDSHLALANSATKHERFLGNGVLHSAIMPRPSRSASPRKMKDCQIRAAVKSELMAHYDRDPDTVVIDELGLRHGASRVDIAVVNGSLHGFELKSDRDTLKRLPRQAKIYNSVLDAVTLVVSARHLERAIELVPAWWGIRLAEIESDGRILLRDLRPPSTNPCPDALAIARLLWRDEVLEFLEELGQAQGLYSKPRAALYSRLLMVTDIEHIRARVRRQLKDRVDWRSAERRVSCGG